MGLQSGIILGYLYYESAFLFVLKSCRARRGSCLRLVQLCIKLLIM